MVYLTFAVIGLGGRGVIKTWTKVAPLHDDVRSHLSGSSAIQPLAASEESWHRYYFIFLTSCKDLLIAKKIEMTFYSIMGSISHLGKMARTSAKSENPNELRS